ncbi:choline/carnitine O-acyltransferase [Desulfovibrio sp. OttesenSCG-928-F20]|nr:choline/carnitine O-acyltransferase [Desulfovibrio sp. OttesenSCG-928-F20]
MKTYSQDHGLPPLPVPDLPASCAAVAEIAAPLVDTEALDSLLADLNDFSRPGGAGELLQGMLTERALTVPGNESWLRPFWDDMYLAWREPLPINMNYFFRFDAQRWGGEKALSRCVLALARVLDSLASEDLEPEQTKTGYLAMEQAASCLYTRIPCAGKDSLIRVSAVCAHISVVCCGHWFLLSLRNGEGEFVGEAALDRAFECIRKEAGQLPPALSLGALSTAPREEAAKLRAVLLEGRQNRLSMASIEKTLFTVCLDPPYENADQAALALLGGDPANRFFDKSLQIIASENGVLGANFEHAGCDAAIWVYLLSQADALIMASANAPDKKSDDEQKLYRLLLWVVPMAVPGRLAAMRKDFQQRLQDVDIACREMSDYGRDNLKSLGTSPDAFLQVAFQVAQHRIFGRLRSSYEAISARSFAQGRTECARGSSGEALAFALALQKGSPKSKLLEFYRQAERIHKSRLQRCQRGLGIERHFYGLHAMWQIYGPLLGIEQEPALFRNPAWQTLRHDALSTSGVGAPFIRFFGFGPVVPDGFGIGYAPEPGKTGLTVSSFRSSKLSASGFIDAFASAAGQIATVLRNDNAI